MKVLAFATAIFFAASPVNVQASATAAEQPNVVKISTTTGSAGIN